MSGTPTIPISEMKHDLEATDRDLARLNLIVENLRLFIRDSDGEDRSFLKMNLLTFESLVAQAARLREKIANTLNAALGIEKGESR